MSSAAQAEACLALGGAVSDDESSKVQLRDRSLSQTAYPNHATNLDRPQPFARLLIRECRAEF
jgi:hypothetical protein